MTRAEDSWSAGFEGLAASGGQVYDGVMVPRLFEPWGRLLVDELDVSPGEIALDVACGPGSVTRLLAARAGSTGAVTGYDLSASMLAVARSKPPVPEGCPIEYLEGSADDLPVDDGAVDLVTCQQGLQFFPDRDSALAEMHRVLRPGGRLGLAVWTGIEDQPAFHAMGEAIEEAAGPELAQRYAGGPWGLGEGRELGALLERAGFREIRVTAHTLPLSFEGGVRQVLSTLAATPLAADVEQLSEQKRRVLHDALVRRVGDGPIETSARSNIALATR